MKRRYGFGLTSAGTLSAVATLLCTLVVSSDASACGCFAPPLPQAQGDFAVNQRAEQIIFEVMEGKVSAHVRILYEGDPAQFAWLLPMPTVPDIELSETDLFAYVDQQTAPVIASQPQNVCPQQKYYCQGPHICYPSGPAASGAAAQPGSFVTDPATGLPIGSGAPPVTVLASARVGSYDTITFAADEAELAIQWLNDNGFIVNETMSPYMQPYLDSGLVFVASKLIPSAELDEIRPLRLTYEAEFPSIPLRLTAIAAEPHMTVTAFIYAQSEYQPVVGELITLPVEDLANVGRNNYPMVLARAIDDAGGFAFIREYRGPGPKFNDFTGCCDTPSAPVFRQELAAQNDAGADSADAGTTGANSADAGSTGARPDGGGSEPATPVEPETEYADVCGVGNDGLCQCPGRAFDAADCSEGLVALDKARELSETYPVLTRITTRISPEEMVEDPMFEVADVPVPPTQVYRLTAQSRDLSLQGCEARIQDRDEYDEIVANQACSATYCDWGECVVTDAGVGCACEDGFVARAFTDGDGLASVTCVPETPPVDFAAGGIELPDVCANADVNGECVDLGGFVGVRCGDDEGASLNGATPSCSPIVQYTSTKGATNYSLALEELSVCAPPPPQCGAAQWLVQVPVAIEGEACDDPPDPSWFDVPPAPDCSESSNGTPAAATPVQSPAPAVSMTLMDTREPRPTTETDSAGDDGCSLGATGSSRPAGWPLFFLVSSFLASVTALRRRTRSSQ